MQQRLAQPKVKYHSEPYDKCNKNEQWIRITDGCPRDCPFCYCPTEIRTYDIPEIKRNLVRVMDMNILANPRGIKILNKLKDIKVNNKVIYYDFHSGFDYRLVTLETAKLIKEMRVIKPRIAWDWFMNEQYKIKDCIGLFKKVGYKGEQIMVFMICNWKISYKECCRKLDLLKVWGVQVDDCYFDNQTMPNVIPIYWTDEENKNFRSKCRKHNQLVNFKIDPEVRWIIEPRF